MIRNITDIDDKILVKSAEAGVSWWAWAARFEREFAAAYDALGCLPPAFEPRATAHIADITALIEILIARGHAYERTGSIYFDVRSFPDYGALTNQKLGDLEPSEDTSDDKKRPQGFRVVEGRQGGRPRTRFLGIAVGPRASRMAHGVLGHGGAVSRG